MTTKAASLPAGLAPQPYIAGARPQTARKLPTQRDWSARRILATQLGIVLTLVLGWEAAARLRMIDPFFWSQPSQIWETMKTFFAEGDAFVDIAFTFRSTLLGFFIGTALGSLLERIGNVAVAVSGGTATGRVDVSDGTIALGSCTLGTTAPGACAATRAARSG